MPPSDVVRDLGVLLACRLKMTKHVPYTARTCFFHRRRIRQVISRLDYCNSVLSGLLSSTLQPLSSVLHVHTAVRLIKDLSPRDHITPTLKLLHWSMPVLHSKSPSSCIISVLEPLHHTCHPWLRHILLPGPEEKSPRVDDRRIIHAWGFCCNLHKSEVWQSCFLGR